MRSSFVALLCILWNGVMAQGSLLLPSIGLSAPPKDTDSICPIPLRLTMEFDPIGYQVGQPVHDFTLYDLAGNAVNLKQRLQSGRPQVVVTCSYTCFIFRERYPELEALFNLYGAYADFLLLYVVEAHPNGDVSPYFGYVNVGSENLAEGILYPQAKTYGERLQTAQQMVDNMTIQVPVILDGPCNEFWTASECGPVTAYLVDTSGLLFAKHGWFNVPPLNFGESLDALLGLDLTDAVSCGALFGFDVNPADTIQSGLPDEVIYFNAALKNDDDSLCASISVIRDKQMLPPGWYSSMCMDICYPPALSKTDVFVMPKSTLPFILDVYTTGPPDTGFIRVTFKNNFAPLQKDSQWFIAITTPETATPFLVAAADLAIYPQPASQQVHVLAPCLLPPGSRLLVTDLQGRMVCRTEWTEDVTTLDVTAWPAGCYLLQANTGGQAFRKSFLVVH